MSPSSHVKLIAVTVAALSASACKSEPVSTDPSPVIAETPPRRASSPPSASADSSAVPAAAQTAPSADVASQSRKEADVTRVVVDKKSPGAESATPATNGQEPPAESAKTGEATASAAAAARKYFATRCASCHGYSGMGDGPGSATLEPKPRAFSDGSWQASVSNGHIAKIIVGGGAAVGKSAAMPPNPDLEDKQELVEELVRLVRAFHRGS